MQNSNKLKKIIGVVALILGGVAYFPATSFWLFLFFTMITVSLAYFSTYLLQRIQSLSWGGKVGSFALLLLALIAIFGLYVSVRVLPNLCSFYLDPHIGRNYFTGVEQEFTCGNMPWYYQRITGIEARHFKLARCQEYVSNNMLLRKYEAEKSVPFDSLSGNFSTTDTSPYLAETEENTFGIFRGESFSFDFSAGTRTKNTAQADIILDAGSIRSISDARIYLVKTKDPYGYDFHLHDKVLETEPLDFTSLEDTHFFFVKTKEGNFAKVAISSVSRSNRNDTIVYIRWAYQPDGSTSLRSDYTPFIKELETRCEPYQ